MGERTVTKFHLLKEIFERINTINAGLEDAVDTFCGGVPTAISDMYGNVHAVL